jgi:hypothetical protein
MPLPRAAPPSANFGIACAVWYSMNLPMSLPTMPADFLIQDFAALQAARRFAPSCHPASGHFGELRVDWVGQRLREHQLIGGV